MNSYSRSLAIRQDLIWPVVERRKRFFINFEGNETVLGSLMLTVQLPWLAVIWVFLIATLA